ncbi:MAG TPA: tetratricopeptide repeat protein [Chitinispirillaceae bacterium]|nr:tetratricopeptide repeat protein [Chitinispirillaceae bacterium]
MLILKQLDTTLQNDAHSSFFLLLFIFGSFSYLFAQKEINYDPEKGIIFSDDNSSKRTAVPGKNVDSKKSFIPQQQSSIEKPAAKNNDIHSNRKKDPPETYYKSGLEYFKNEDFSNALKNFSYADSLTSLPLYKLWKAKSLRRLNNIPAMFRLLSEIATKNDNSDIADDALLELAIYYKSSNDYEKSLETLTKLIEQYPFGVSCATGEELPEIARDQRRLIRQEMINSLAIIGYQEEDLASAYREFQQTNGLKITGTGTVETVALIKQLHEQLLQKQDEESEQAREHEKYQWIMVVCISVFLSTFVLLIILRLTINSRKKHLLELKDILLELDTGKL